MIIKISLQTIFICVVILNILLVQLASASDGESQYSRAIFSSSFVKKNQTEELIPNEVYIRQLKGSEKQIYTVRAVKGKCLRFIFEQKGIDIMIAIRDAEHKLLKKVDRPSGNFGRESVTFIVPQTAIFYVEIETWLKDAIAGNFQFSYSETDIPAQSDRWRAEAETLTSKAELLRGEGTKESKEFALIKFDEALKVWQKLGDVYEQAVIYYGIGYTYYGLSNHYEAALAYNRALKLHSQNKDEFGQAVNYAALGSVKYTLNNYDLSAFYYQKAIKIYKSLGNIRGLGIVYHGLGNQRFLSEQYDEALDNFMESLRWRILANDSLGKARTHISIAKFYLYKEKYPSAQVHLLEAEKTLGKDRAEKEAELQYYFGKYYLLTGDLAKSEVAFSKTKNIFIRIGNKLGLANTLMDQSRLQTKLLNYEKALENIKKAVSLIEEIRYSTLDFRERINFSATIQPFYEQYILILMKLQKHDPNKKFTELALVISEQARARGLLDQLERRRLIQQNQISEELLEKEQELLDSLTSFLAVQQNIDDSKLTAEFLDISNQIAQVEAEINRKFTSPQDNTLPTLTISEIRSYINKNTVLFEYWITDEESFLFVLKDKEVRTYELEPGEKIEALAKTVFNCFSNRPSLIDAKTCQQKNAELSDILLKPIMKEINNEQLLIVKGGGLQYIPFAALIYPGTQNYLVEKNEIVSLPSVSVIKYLNQTEKVYPNKTLAIFADPIYSAKDGRVVKNKRLNKEDKAYFPRLLATRFEANAISSFIRTEDVLLKTDSDASRETVLKSNLADYKIIHFATHTITNDQNPELTAIALSLYDQSGNPQNGFIYLNDILRLNLNAHLVTLSSCRSGTGKQIKGEGLISLSNSFFSIGIQNLLSSLWEVDDKVTAEMMKRFYQKHIVEKKKISVALREAQIEIMNDKRWKTPFYWSAFILQGTHM